MTQHKLLNNQLEELKEAFDTFDTDGSGEITSNELRSVLYALDLPYVEEEVYELMNAMDRNGDGRIQFHEFAKVMGSHFYAKKSEDSIIMLFRRFDKDKSGTISGDELRLALKEMRGNITRREAEELIRRVDIDGSGTVNIAEFIKLMSMI